MLLVGPPHILIVGPPFMANDPASVGCRTIIGIGESTLAIAATALALAVEPVEPSSRINVVFRLRVIVTRIRLGSSSVESLAAGTPMLSGVGKSYATSGVVTPKPFRRP